MDVVLCRSPVSLVFFVMSSVLMSRLVLPAAAAAAAAGLSFGDDAEIPQVKRIDDHFEWACSFGVCGGSIGSIGVTGGSFWACGALLGLRGVNLELVGLYWGYGGSIEACGARLNFRGWDNNNYY